MRSEIPIPAGAIKQIDSDTWVEVVDRGPAFEEPQRLNPSDTSWHEATHVVPGYIEGSILLDANRIGQDKAAGTTSFSSFSAVAAVAPDAAGHGGTSWDMYLAKKHGVNISAAKKRARAIIAANGELISAVASRIQEKGRISQYDVVQEDRALKEKERRKDDRIVDLFVYRRNKSEKIGNIETKGETVVFVSPELDDLAQQEDSQVDNIIQFPVQDENEREELEKAA